MLLGDTQKSIEWPYEIVMCTSEIETEYPRKEGRKRETKTTPEENTDVRQNAQQRENRPNMVRKKKGTQRATRITWSNLNIV